MHGKIAFLLALMVVCAVSSPSATQWPCACARIYYPICASDGQTYNSMCEYTCRAKYLMAEHGKHLTIVKEGLRCEELN